MVEELTPEFLYNIFSMASDDSGPFWEFVMLSNKNHSLIIVMNDCYGGHEEFSPIIPNKIKVNE